MTVTKEQLTEAKRGKGGTRVRYLGATRTMPAINPEPFAVQGEVYIVKDLMTRRQYNKPDRIGIGPADRGYAFGVNLAEIEPA